MDLEAIKVAVIDFIREHQAWAPFVVGALALAKSIAFLSLLAPAIVILVALGPVIVTAGLDFRTIWLGAALGAALGDALSYWIGWRFKFAAFRVWPLSRHPEMIVFGERFFLRFGAWAIFIGRFFGPARAVVPLIAGIFQMPQVLFQAANFASAFVWAFVLLAPGAGLAKYLNW